MEFFFGGGRREKVASAEIPSVVLHSTAEAFAPLSLFFFCFFVFVCLCVRRSELTGSPVCRLCFSAYTSNAWTVVGFVFFFFSREVITLLVPLSRFGDSSLRNRLVCHRDGTAVLKRVTLLERHSRRFGDRTLEVLCGTHSLLLLEKMGESLIGRSTWRICDSFQFSWGTYQVEKMGRDLGQ